MRRLASGLVIAFVVGTALLAGAVTAAPSLKSTGAVSAPWANASVVVQRRGWHVRVTAYVLEKEGYSGCVKAEVTLDVEGWTDPQHTTTACTVGDQVRDRYTLVPGYGTRIRELRLKVCNPRRFRPDQCEETTVPVYQNRAERLDLVGGAEARMTESMAAFQRNRRAQAGPWDWNSNGCNSPAIRPDLFRKACQRRDFGYRNFATDSP